MITFAEKFKGLAEEIVNLVDAGLDFYLTANRYAESFESEFADFFGLSNAILVNSGSSANLVALTTLTSEKVKGSFSTMIIMIPVLISIGIIIRGTELLFFNHYKGGWR